MHVRRQIDKANIGIEREAPVDSMSRGVWRNHKLVVSDNETVLAFPGKLLRENHADLRLVLGLSSAGGVVELHDDIGSRGQQQRSTLRQTGRRKSGNVATDGAV